MDYTARIELLPGAGLSSSGLSIHKLCGGVIHRVSVTIPDGCMDLVGVKIRNGLHQLWPSLEGTYYRGNGVTYSFRESYELTKDINIIYIDGANCDTLYTHYPIICFSILPAAAVAPWLRSESDRLAAFLGLS
jgi:hypothetical protein